MYLDSPELYMVIIEDEKIIMITTNKPKADKRAKQPDVTGFRTLTEAHPSYFDAFEMMETGEYQ